jgi:uncharacterized protein YyaL (SSP411 family)
MKIGTQMTRMASPTQIYADFKNLCKSALLASALSACYFSCYAQNALINEKSPYLLQHAHNPVNWTAWGKQTDSQKLKIISIGYAACHWCHVMEKESFADSSVAALMNQNFINIKVDREERPDIDNIYMVACQMTNENGCGWPLNVIALPDGKPVWIGSYLPKKEWTEKLNYFLNIQQNQGETLKQYANHLKESIQETQKSTENKENLVATSLKKMVENIKKDIDFEDGGLIETPKFPTPSLFEFLLKYEQTNPDDSLKKGINLTLNRMAQGGIYDHLAGGFSRYSTDEQWAIPHFEKMLYDNAQLISLYARASVQNVHYEVIARQTIAFLEENLKAKSGGFYSSIDADSEGKEGQYYTWTKAEIEQVLGNDASAFWQEFELKEGVIVRKWNADVSTLISVDNKSVNISVAKHQRYQRAIEKLEQVRQKRTKPATDTKIITSWNALIIKAYIDAYRFLGDEVFLENAKNLATYITQKHLSSNGELRRVNYQNSAGFLDDYAYSIDALVALYQVSFEQKWLNQANLLTDYVFKHFKQNGAGLFEYSPKNELFVASTLEIADGVLPSANAVLANVLHDLGILFQNDNYTQASNKMLLAMREKLNSAEHASDYYYWGNLLQKQQKPPFEVQIVGKDVQKLLKNFLKTDNIILMGAATNEPLPMLKNKLRKGKTIIYVCQNNVCKMPTEDFEEAKLMLNGRAFR